MKTIKIFSILLLFFCMCTGMKCKKATAEPIPTLPAETQSGKHTFGCLVNGEVWLPKAKSFYPALTASIQFDILNLHSSRLDEGIMFAIINLDHVGEYSLNLTNVHTEYVKAGDIYKCIEGKLIITKFDKSNKILSGTFWFKAKNGAGQIVTVDDGRFDLKYTD